MLIDGFGISGYRSFGEEMQYFAPLGKINLLIGKNNCGKSNVLRFLNNYLASYLRDICGGAHSNITLKSIDEHIGINTTNFQFNFAINLKAKEATKKLETFPKNIRNLVLKFFSSPFIKNNKGLFWIVLGRPNEHYEFEISKINKGELQSILNYEEWKRISSDLIKASGNVNDNIINTIMTFAREIYKIYDIFFIPAIRFVHTDTKKIDEKDLSGNGIIEKLAKYQNPNYNRQDLKKGFNKINDFLRSVVENDTAKIEIPFERDKIIVHLDGKSLPLESIGTGIQEVIILAAAATLQNNSIICMEEPEIHLHPVLQKKLLKYLDENTTNQYFIATHSAHFLDYKNASVFHITHDGTASKVRHVDNNEGIFEICGDLGYRPSDLLQTNCIIWVEGPSDRIYINYWLKSLDDSLVEGIHYSIMFYGGRLLSHLSADDKAINEFISLLCINRSPIIVIDSDKKKKSDPINATKQRIVEEFGKKEKIAWVTEGREIENYIKPDIYEAAIKRIHKSVDKLVSGTKYSNLPNYYTTDKQKKTAEKIKVAKEIVEQEADLSVYDLKERMEEVLEFVRKANGMGEENPPKIQEG